MKNLTCKYLLLALTLCFLFTAASAFAADSAKTETIKLTSVELADAFAKDTAAAEAEYTGELVEITGKVTENYTMSMPDRPHVSLEGNEWGAVLCYFDGPQDLLEKGREVVIKGRCIGALMKRPMLEACEIIKR